MENSESGAENLKGDGYPVFIMHTGKYDLVVALSIGECWRAEQTESQNQYSLGVYSGLRCTVRLGKCD